MVLILCDGVRLKIDAGDVCRQARKLTKRRENGVLRLKK